MASPTRRQAVAGLLLATPAAAQRRRRSALELLLDSTEANRFADFVALANAEADFSAPGAFAFFIPVNAAIETLDPALLNPLRHNRAMLAGMLRNHIGAYGVPIAGAGTSEAGETASFRSRLGQTMLLNSSGGLPRINGVPILTTNIAVTNGLVHLIDGVLLPV